MKVKKINKVLITLDYNSTAQKVAEAGNSLAKAAKAEVTLLHVTSDPLGSVTEKVLHHTSIPLFIVPTKKEQSGSD